MNDKLQHEIECSQFEALLAEGLDGTLAGGLKQAFDLHGQTCPDCGPMLAEAREGMLLLEALPEVEPPKNLVHNILAVTSRAEAKGTAPAQPAKVGWLDRLRIPTMLQTRFVTSFCMAFFSLSLTLSLAGVKVSDVTRFVMHPTELRKNVVLQYTQLEAKVERYYDNMRLVVEYESRVRDLRKAASPAQGSEDEKKDNKQQQNRNDAPDTSHGPEQEKENYSRERDGSILARQMMMRSEGAQI
jgi:putative zinc finger protein